MASSRSALASSWRRETSLRRWEATESSDSSWTMRPARSVAVLLRRRSDAATSACLRGKQRAFSWRPGGLLQRRITPQAAPSFGQPRPISRLGRAGATAISVGPYSATCVQLAPRRPPSAPGRAPGCPELRPACSANQPVGPRWRAAAI
eukprot:scaffold81355_cov49-Phaeocystis_antarctica.AAC.1